MSRVAVRGKGTRVHVQYVIVRIQCVQASGIKIIDVRPVLSTAANFSMFEPPNHV